MGSSRQRVEQTPKLTHRSESLVRLSRSASSQRRLAHTALARRRSPKEWTNREQSPDQLPPDLRRTLSGRGGSAASLPAPGPATIWVDVDAARILLARVEQLGHTSQEASPSAGRSRWPFGSRELSGGRGWIWVYERRKEVDEVRYNARLWLAEAAIGRGAVGQAEDQWRALLATDPIDEDVLEVALTRLHQHGMTTKALRLYTQVEERLEKAEEGMLSQRIHTLVDRFQQASSTENMPETPLLVSGEVRHTSSRLLFHPEMENRSFPLSFPDHALWFGEKVASFFTLVETLSRLPDGCVGIQEKLGKALHAMPPMSDDDLYMGSRRQLLIALATLPSTLLFSCLQHPHSSSQEERFLARCSASLTACWHLMRGSDYAIVEEFLPTYLPFLTKYAQEPSKHQQTAARLATQGYRLKGILALHHNDVKMRDDCFQQAVFYAEMAEEPGLLVAALISLGYHRVDPKEAELLYLKACVYETQVSALQRSRLYAELAVASAQLCHCKKALDYLDAAQRSYPSRPETDTSFLYAEFSPSSLVMEMGRVHLALAEHYPDGQHAQDAWDTLVGIEEPTSQFVISERIRCEVVNYQAKTALALGDRDLCYHYLERGAQGAVSLRSAKRRSEVLATRNKALLRWPHDRQVKELQHIFLD